MPDRIVLLAGPGESTSWVYHALRGRFTHVEVIQEAPQSRWELARRRVKRYGLLVVLGQAAFTVLVQRYLRWVSQGRIRTLLGNNGLCSDPVIPSLCVSSVNDEATRIALRRLSPSVVVVNGTRIINTTTLQCVDAPFINMHAGVTPTYRGVHGAYWALRDRNPREVGTTVHLVDEGIDTGSRLAVGYFEIESEDNFATYPIQHAAAGIPLLLSAVQAALEGSLARETGGAERPSVLRTHPTLWDYLWGRLIHRVR